MEVLFEFGNDSWGSCVLKQGEGYAVYDWFQGGEFQFVHCYEHLDRAIDASHRFMELRP